MKRTNQETIVKRPIQDPKNIHPFSNLDIQKCVDLLEKRGCSNHYVITDDWLCGFILAEGSFYCLGRNRYPTFSISQHANDSFLIEAIRQHIGGGSVRMDLRKDGRIATIYTLAGKEKIEQYLLPRITCLPFQPNISPLKNDWLNSCFPGIKLADTPLTEHLFAAFTDGDGSFHTVIRNARDYRIGFQLQAVFDLAQKPAPFSVKSEILDRILKNYFSNVPHQYIPVKKISKGICHLRFVRADILHNHVVSFFDRVPLRS